MRIPEIGREVSYHVQELVQTAKGNQWVDIEELSTFSAAKISRDQVIAWRGSKDVCRIVKKTIQVMPCPLMANP